ncbi:MAG: PKD domain-containing protein [Cytophagaceae bacterium]
MRRLFPFLILLFFLQPGFSQVIINEVCSSNGSTFPDSDGDFEDWIEFYNTNPASSVNIHNWMLTDNLNRPDKWRFPNVSIPPNGYLTIWASGKDRVERVDQWENVIRDTDTWRYLVPSASVPTAWRGRDFDDNSWSQGPGGFGFGDPGVNTILPNGTRSVFIRRTFNVTDINRIEQMIFSMDYDDGFIAYINGVEIARENMTSTAYNAWATTYTDPVMSSGGVPGSYTISRGQLREILVEGTNVLSVQTHNVSAVSSDLVARPFLHAGTNGVPVYGRNVETWFEVPVTGIAIHTNFSISATDGEPLLLSNASGNPVTQIEVPPMGRDQTWGRFPNAGPNWRILSPPTPNASNGTATAFQGYWHDVVTFSVQGGFYSGSQTITMTAGDINSTIRYTTDGTKPGPNSPVYTGPVSVGSTRVVRAAAFRSGYITTQFTTHSYFINFNTTLPVISLSTAPNDLFHPDTGMYVRGPGGWGEPPHRGANWYNRIEKEVNFEYFTKSKERVLSQQVGYMLFGGWSRANHMKSVRIHPRNAYDDENRLNYKFFDERPYDVFNTLHLRNGGNDFAISHLRDHLNNRVLGGINKTHIDFSAYEPALVFYNGQYWGIHQIRERYNHGYFTSVHGLGQGEFDMVEMDGDVVQGDNSGYLDMLSFVENNDMSNQANYEAVKEMVDIENLVDYFTAQIYHTNWDWPHNNIKYWKPKAPGGKWRYLYYDTDFAFALFNMNDASGKIGGSYSATFNEFRRAREDDRNVHSPFFKKLFDNIEFRNYFCNRFADLVNTTYRPSHYKSVLNELKNEIDPEMDRHMNHFQNTSSDLFGSVRAVSNRSDWEFNVQRIRDFMDARPTPARNHIVGEFGSVIKTVNITLQASPVGAGEIRINTITPESLPWNGVYFDGVPVTITAFPNEGYEFSNWTSSDVSLPSSTDETVTVNVNTNNTFTAVFSSTPNYPRITISEINYNSHSSHDTEDWIEFHNYGGAPANMSGWYFSDQRDYHVFTFPEGTTIPAGGYLVVARDLAMFSALNPDVPAIGDFGFGLGNNGELIRLYNSRSQLYISMTYDDSPPWPSYANGRGGTLELLDPEGDLNDPANWFDGCRGGSPGGPYVECPCEDVDLGEDVILCAVGGNATLETGMEAHVDRDFRWYRNGSRISGAAEPTLSIIEAGEYEVRVDSMGCFKNDFVIVYPDLSVDLGSDGELCDPAVHLLTTGLTMPGINHVWSRDGEVIAGANDHEYIVTVPGEYSVTVSSSGCDPRTDDVLISSAAALPNHGERCGPGTVDLSVTGNGSNYGWYTANTGGSPIGSGPTFTSPIIEETTTYYVQDDGAFAYTGGAADLSIGTVWGANASDRAERKLRFNVLQPFVLDAVTVYTRRPSTNLVIRVLANDGTTVVHSSSQQVNVEGMARIPLNFEMETGNGYYMDLVGTDESMSMNGGGATYPYVIPDYLSIYSCTPSHGADQGWYPFFYNWEISSGTIPCSRVPVIATINALPAAAGPISGAEVICTDATGIEYSIEEVDNAIEYEWTVPDGAIISGQGTNVILVDFGSSGGEITVTPKSPCGDGEFSSINVVTGSPGAAGEISGSLEVCAEQSGVAFSIEPLPGVSNYIWTVPADATITNGEGTESILVTFGNSGGAITVVPTSDCGNGISSEMIVTMLPLPSDPGVITGPESVCANQNGVVYSIEEIPGVTEYLWTVPSGVTITNGAGTNEITLAFGASGGNLIVAPVNSCGTGNESFLAISIEPAPEAPGSISGETSLCGGTVSLYSIDPVPGALSYTWSLPDGATINAGSGTNSIEVLMGNSSGTVTVSPVYTCPTILSSEVDVTINPIPSEAGDISGPSTACEGEEGIVYSIEAVTNADTYTWSVPGGASFVNSSPTEIIVDFATSAGDITVIPENACGIGQEAVLAVSLNEIPSSLGTISGPAEVCVGEGEVQFSVVPVSGVDTYLWTAPDDAVITGQGTATITIDFGSEDGMVSVTPENSCGSGSASQHEITINPTPELVEISGPSDVCSGEEAISFTIDNIVQDVIYTWEVPDGANIVTGQGEATISVDFSASSGFVSVTPSNTCGSGSIVNHEITILPLPDDAGSITGPLNVCSSETDVIYSIDPVDNASNYIWSVPGDAVLSGQGTTEISVDFATSPGEITVIAENACGTSEASSLSVTLNSIPGDAGTISGPATVCAGQSVAYTVPSVTGASAYNWQIPADASISGQGTRNVTITFGIESGEISVTPENSCGNGNSSVRNITINLLPTSAGTINGNQEVCLGSEGVVYAIDPVDNASSYTWTLPGDAEITSGVSTNSIEVSIGSTGGSISVIPVNSCGEGTSSSIEVYLVSQPEPVSIAGDANPACNESGVAYSVPATAGSEYTWSVPDGAIITSGQGSSEIFVDFGSVNGFIQVIEINSAECEGSPNVLNISLAGCNLSANFQSNSLNPCPGEAIEFTSISTGISENTTYEWDFGADASPATAEGIGPHAVSYSSPGSKTVSLIVTDGVSDEELKTSYINVRELPQAAGPIAGLVELCEGETGLAYSIEPVTNASQYQWALTGGTISSGQGSRNITVNFSASTASLSVIPNNACGSGIVSDLDITIRSAPSEFIEISGPAEVCSGAEIQYSVEPVSGVDEYIWTVPEGANILSGQGSASIEVTFGVTSGTITVEPVNSCGSGDVESIPVSVYNTGASAGSISGPGSLCPEEEGIQYFVNPVPGASSYSWNLPVDAVITAGENTNEITVTWGETTGDLSVTPLFSCGTGVASSISISLHPAASLANAGTERYITTNSVNLDGNTPVSGTGQWSLASGSGSIQNPANPGTLVTGLSEGENIFHWTISGSCGSNYDAVSIFVGSIPTLTEIDGPDYVEAGNTYEFTVPAEAGTDYTWTVPDGATIVSGQGTNSISVTFPAGSSGTLTVVGENAYGSNSASLTVNVGSVPTVPVITGPQFVEAGNTYEFTVPAEVGTDYTWAVPDGALIVSGQGTNTLMVTFPEGTSGDISVTASNNHGSTSDNLTVSVGNAPALTEIDGPDYVEAGNTYEFTVPAEAGTDYTWTVPDGATIVSGQGSNTLTVTFPAGSSGTLTVVGENAYGNNSASLTINVGSAPAVPVITGPQFVEAGNTYEFTIPSEVGTDYSWAVPDGAVIVSGQGTNTLTVTFPEGTSGDISVTASNNHGSTSDNLTISVGNAPALTEIDGPDYVEAGNTYEFTVPAEAGTDYTWTVPDGATIVSGQETNTLTVTFPAGSSGNISVTASNNYGSTTINHSVNVGAAPVATAITGPAYVRPDILYTYSVPEQAGVDYVWNIPVGANIVSGQGTNSIQVTFPYGTDGTVSVLVYNQYGSYEDELTISIGNPPVAHDIVRPEEIFPEEEYEFSVPFEEGVDYNWIIPPGATIVSGEGSNAIIIIFEPGTSGNVVVETTNNYGTTSSSTAVNLTPTGPAPELETIDGPSVVNANNSYVFTVPNEPGVNYNWTVPAGAEVISGQGTNSVTIRFLSTGTGNVSVIATNEFGSSTESIYVDVNPINFVINGSAEVESGNTYIYSVEYEPDVFYTWTVPDGAVIISGNGTNRITVYYNSTGVNGNISVHRSNPPAQATLAISSIDDDEEPNSIIGANVDSYEVYPNPFHDNTNIKVESGTVSEIFIKVFDIKGVLRYESVGEFRTNESFVIGNELNAGMYMVQISYDDKFIMLKLIKL